MSDWLQVDKVKEINISHINNKNCDGYSTIISFVKHDGTQTQVTASSKTRILHTKDFDDADIFDKKDVSSAIKFYKKYRIQESNLRRLEQKKELIRKEIPEILMKFIGTKREYKERSWNMWLFDYYF